MSHELRGGDEAGRAFAWCVLADVPLADDGVAAAQVQDHGMPLGTAV